MRPPFIALSLALLTIVGCASGDEKPPATPPVTAAPVTPPPATISPAHLMTGLVLLHHHALLQSLSETPASPEEWRSAETHAELLVEAAEILLRHTSASEESWRAAADSLKEGGLETLAGLEARSLAEARSGFEHLNTACSTCHQECGADDAPPWK